MPVASGTYTLYITLLGEAISGSPWTVTIIPGEVSPTLSTTNLGVGPLSFTAGMTKFFQIKTYDIYGNAETLSYDTT